MSEDAPDEGETATEMATWQALLDAQVRLEDQRSSLRSSVLGVFLAVVLVAVLVRRFVFITEPVRWLLMGTPALILVVAGLVDHFVLGARVRRLTELAQELDASDRLGRVRRRALDDPTSGWVVAAFYGIPATVSLGFVAWGLL